MIFELVLYYLSFIESILDYSKWDGVDIFSAISTEDPGAYFPKKNHPRNTRSRLSEADADSGKPIPTNKFYGNLLDGNGEHPAWTHPYSVFWMSEDKSLGVGYSTDKHFAESTSNSESSQYFYAWPRQRQIGFSAKEFGSDTTTSIDSLEQLSVNYNVFNKGSNKKITFPLVQGMGFITGIYNDLIPRLVSDEIESFGDRKEISPGLIRYIISVRDIRWAMYVFTEDNSPVPEFKKDGNVITTVDQNSRKVTIQVAIITEDKFLNVLDSAAGNYVSSSKLFGHINSDSATYGFNFVTKPEAGKKVLHFALPHHQESFHQNISNTATDLYMDTVTKGKVRAYYTENFSFNELLDESLSFMPQYGFEVASSTVNLTDVTVDSLRNILGIELNRKDAFLNECQNQNFYMSAKSIDKIAVLLLTARFVLSEENQEYRALLDVLKDIFRRWIKNEHPSSPLVYDTTHGGIIVEKGMRTSKIQIDSGNANYNDHHFHYGYIIHAAAVLGRLEPSWLEKKNVRSWVNMLARDISNPNDDQDKYFTESRVFDWFHGHSWAKGIYQSADGKNEESTSEDYHHMFSLMLWGKVTDNVSMEGRSRLGLAIMKRSMNKYFLLASDNNVQPKKIVANKVTGILFENKIDYTTYFGTNREYIHGIHMLPTTAASEYVRPKKFVKEEMEEKFPDAVLNEVKDGWRGILYNNLALSDPHKSYGYFKNTPWDANLIDNGQSWSYALLYSALMGGQGN